MINELMKQKRNTGHRWVRAHLETKYSIRYLHLATLKRSMQSLNILIGEWKILPNAISCLEHSSKLNIQAICGKSCWKHSAMKVPFSHTAKFHTIPSACVEVWIKNSTNIVLSFVSFLFPRISLVRTNTRSANETGSIYESSMRFNDDAEFILRKNNNP